jgi:hypothetical protein
MLKILAGVGLAAAVVLSTAPAFAGDQDFNLKNQTGYTIKKLYISAVSTNAWEEDILGRDTLANGEEADIKFSHEEAACHWDMKVEFEDGSSAEWGNFNLCNINAIDIKYDKDTNTTTAEYE